MSEDGYTHIGWLADQDVTVNKAAVAAGTVIPVSTSVTLSTNTTFTGVWKANSTFALTSANEVEVAVAGTSTITSENNAGIVTYESADPAIATVSASGVITGVASGKTTITVTDPGDGDTAGGSATVTVLVPYANPAAAESYVLNQDTYAFSNDANTKYYFTNGFTMTPSSAAGLDNGSLAKSKKYSAARSYTIKTPSNVTVKYAVITARNNYANENSNPAANWGTVFGTNYSSETLPWSTESAAEKDFVVESPSAGAELSFQPGGNQWQAIINLYTIEHHAKYAVSYAAGEGTGSMTGSEVRGGSTIALPASTFTAPSGKAFAGWLCSVDGTVYAAGSSYTMTDEATTFTAQYGAPEGCIIKAQLTGNKAATVTGAIGGTASVSVQNTTDSDGGYKFGGDGQYIGITLTSGWTFKTGDVVNVHITTVDNTGGEIIFYNSDKSVIYDTDEKGEIGDNKFSLPVAANGKTALYIYRINDSNKWNAYVDYIEVYRPASATITASGWNTFSSNNKLDLSTISGGTAYVASAAEGSTVTLTPCTDIVAAGTGLMINGNAGETFTINTTTDDATFSGTNKLVGVPNGGTVTASSNNYVFGWENAAEPGFYYVNDTEPVLGVGKAYLHTDATLTTAGARLSIVFDDNDPTGISVANVNANRNDNVYDLQGRRVAQPQRGLYIMNGRKVLVRDKR